MTEHTSDHENPSKTPSRPEGQDTSETMDNKNPQDPGTTEVLPAAETPPTQEIAQATQRLPQGPAPEGEVHPAYGVAAARVQEQEAAATVVQDAPARDDSDPLAALRDPASGTTAPASGPAQSQPGQAQPTRAQPVQQARPAEEQPTKAAARRGPRVGTAVWGLIVIAVGLGILAVSAGVMFDVGVALILLLGAAGVILVVGSVVSSIRRR
ncbi:hypothetical protein [Promicromonospora sp. NPDC023805]|uniref:hypothetical protein n=1 Tax=Promicromonospora sp. NPDC023805 TaxID=3154696 RepID=UPI0033D4AB7A